MNGNSSFGQWLRQRRKALDLTQADLADQVGCSLATIQKIEMDERRPSKQIAERMADVLAISLDDRATFLAFARRSEVPPPSLPVRTPQPAPLHNLPSQPTSFIGRADEIAQIAARLADPACRLLTLIGPGGVGKTRLALQVAASKVGSFADGVHFVSLVSVGAADLIASSIASTIRFSFYGAEEPRVQIIDYLRDKAMLLVLDNFEHLLSGTALLTDILAHSTQVKFLVTSRERLNLQEEWMFVVEGLSFPTNQASAPAESFPAVQLFAQRAQQVNPTFSLMEERDAVIAICQKVEGLPLGVELAATWLRMMTAQQIVAQMTKPLDFLMTPLRNVPERHQNMRAVFERSWHLLSEAERDVLMKFAVFRGGADLQAAAQVADAPLPILAGLVDKSLVRLNQANRYDMHELVREYASERLLESGTVASVERRHFEYFLNLTEQARRHLFSPQSEMWFDRLEADHDNLRAALDWSLKQGEGELGLQLVEAARRFWRQRFYRSEGRAWLEKLLARSPSTPSPLRAKALSFVGLLASDLGDNLHAETLNAQAIAMARSLGDKSSMAWSLTIQGHITRVLYGGRQAVAPLEEALALFRELGTWDGRDFALTSMGRALLDQHEYERARLVLEEGLAVMRQAGAALRIAYIQILLGNISCYQSAALGQAADLFQETLVTFRACREKWGITDSLLGLASVARAQGDYERAQQLYQESLTTMGRETGYKYCLAEVFWGLGSVARVVGTYEQAQQYYEEGLTLNRGLERWDTAYCLAGLGALAGIRQEPRRAVKLLAAADFLFRNYRDLYPHDRIIFERDMATVRTQLDEAAFAANWADGQAMTLDQAASYALGDANV